MNNYNELNYRQAEGLKSLEADKSDLDTSKSEGSIGASDKNKDTVAENAEIQAISKANEELEKQLAEQKLEHENSIKDKDSEVGELQQKLKALEAELDTTRSDLDQHKEALKAAGKENEVTNNSELNQETIEFKKQLDEANEKIDKLSHQLEITENDLFDAEDDLALAQQEIKELQAAHEKTLNELNEEQDENESLLTKLDNFQKEKLELVSTVESGIEKTKVTLTDLIKDEDISNNTTLKSNLENAAKDLQDIKDIVEKSIPNEVTSSEDTPQGLEDKIKIIQFKKQKKALEIEEINKKASESEERRGLKKLARSNNRAKKD